MGTGIASRASGQPIPRHEAWLDAVRPLAWLYDENSHILTIEDAITGEITREDTSNSSSLTHVYLPDRELLKTALRMSLENNIPLHLEFRYMRDGEPIPFWAVGIKATAGSAGRTLVGIALDASNRSREESRLREDVRLDSTFRFAATLADELHNPLAAVTNCIYLLRQEDHMSKDARDYLDLASESLERVNRLSKFLLGVYHEQEVRRRLHIADLVDAAVEQCLAELKVSGVQIDRRYELTPFVEVFEKQLESAFGKIISNALESCPTGGPITIHVFCSYNWRATGGRGVWIITADKGSGIPAELRGKLTQPFFTTKREPGRGLGLWSAKWIIRKHNGSLLIHSSTEVKHSGTSVGIFIPEQC